MKGAKGVVRSLRLQKELWDKIEQIAVGQGENVNRFCARELYKVCEDYLKRQKKEQNKGGDK